MKKQIKLFIICSSSLIILLLCCYLLLLKLGILWINEPFRQTYPVRGVDVSHYQGEIDWDKLSEYPISFAFIKATEGSSSQDEYYLTNREEISKTDLVAGYYHFFSFDSSGKEQARNYIETVSKDGNLLPPVVDVEYYGNKEKNPPTKEKLHQELDMCLDELEQYYGKKPIIYTTMKVYLNYIDGHYDNYDLWIRNTYYRPFIIKDRAWTFWQYSDTEVLSGYQGDEKYIDMNIFNGSETDFKHYYQLE